MYAVTVQGGESLVDTFERLARSLRDFSPEMREIGKRVAARIDRNFLDASSLYDPLAPRTKRAREARERLTGVAPVAGIDAPLRESDRLRRAATARTARAPGSAYQQDKTRVVVGVNPEEIHYARRALLGRPSNPHIPERDAITITDQDWAQVLDVLDRAIDERLQLACAGK